MANRAEILVAGAGAAGLTTAIALAQAGFEVAVVGRLDAARNGRTVALFEASVRLYRSLGALERLEPFARPLKRIRLIDDTGSFFRTEPVLLRAAEIGIDAFGINIANADLVAALAEEARRTPGVTLIEDTLMGHIVSSRNISARLGAGGKIEAAVLIGADGRRSSVRTAAGIGFREWSYPQTALTAIVAHARGHFDTSTEFHTRVGPCTLVPLPATAERKHRSSLVWLMSPEDATRRMALDDAALAAELRAQTRDLHGEMEMEGPRGAFPMAGLRCHRLTSTRVALVADAGHAFPPIGAQGLNLGLRDVAQLASSLGKHGRVDPGAPAALADYEAARRFDVATRVAGVAALNSSLLAREAPVDFLRAAGLAAMAHVGPLRRALMREGIAPAGRLPPLMRSPRKTAKTPAHV
jgi:2-octaprenyl-6-methoxyphenol hydroxylase